MKKLLLIILFCLCKYIYADNSGTDFWLCFPQNYTRMASNIIYIISDFNTAGTVTAYGVPSTSYFSLSASTYTTVTLPYSAASYGNDTISNTGIHIESEQPVTVYCLSKYTDTSDGFLAIPVNGLGTNYIALCYSGRNLDTVYYDSQIAIAATEDNTTVHIDCPVNPGARPSPYDIILNKGQVYQLCDVYSSKQDLTGTIITGDKPVAVFSGHRCAKIPADYMAADFLVEQLPPTNSWGTKYLTMPLAGRDIADTYRIIAAEDNTNITVNATPIPTLNKGQAVQFLSGVSQQILSNKPVFVAQYANGMTFDYKTGDPFMMNIISVDQYINNSKIIIPTGYSFNYLTIITPNSAINNILLDGSNINPSFFSSIGTSGYAGARISIMPGMHTITSSDNFGVWAYGFRDYESYGYPGGTGIQIYTPTITPTFTSTNTITPTHSISPTFTTTRTFTVTQTSSSTRTITPTRTETPTRTITTTITPTYTFSSTRTVTSSRTSSSTFTYTRTATLTRSQTITMTSTLENTYTITNTLTIHISFTNTLTPTPTFTNTVTYSNTEIKTLSFTATKTITQTNTSTTTLSYTFTLTPSLTNTLYISPTITFTITDTFTVTITKTITASPTINLNQPLIIDLKGSFPDFNKINIVFLLSKNADITIKIFTVSGEIVLNQETKGTQGYNIFSWDGLNYRKRKVASGVYIYKIIAQTNIEKRFVIDKLFIIK